MDIPENVVRGMKDAELAWGNLVRHATANNAKMPKDVVEYFVLFADVIAKSHNTLKRLIDANL